MGRLYHEGHIKSLFIEEVLPKLCQLVRVYRGNHKRSELITLVEYVDSLTALRGPTTGPPHTSRKKGDRGESQAITVAQLNSSDVSTGQASIIDTFTDNEWESIRSLLLLHHRVPSGSAGPSSASSLTSADL